jgi:hypothetical protein
LLADKIIEEALGPYGARPNCSHWPVEKATLFIQGPKVTSGMKQQLASQLSDMFRLEEKVKLILNTVGTSYLL